MKNLGLITALIFCLCQVNAQIWQEKAQFLKPDPHVIYNKFGRSISISGNYAIVGDTSDDKDINSANSLHSAGSAYIFERDQAGDWHFTQKIVASDREANDQFGNSVSISGDYIFVGAVDYRDLNGHPFGGGACYVFEREENGNWKEVQKLQASDVKLGLHFGWSSVAVSGQYAIIGALADYDDMVNVAGSAYIFERSPYGRWQEVSKLIPPDRAAKDRFGNSVSISGNFAIIGAFTKTVYTSSGDTLESAGTAYIFERDQNGSWNNGQKIVPADLRKGDRFGSSVSISGDYAIIGAPEQDVDPGGVNSINGTGAAYIYQRDQNGIWNNSQKLTAPEQQVYGWFGTSVSIDGNTAIVGEYGDDLDLFTSPRSGVAYVFEKNDHDDWLEVKKFTPETEKESSEFGFAVSISGNIALITANKSLTQTPSGGLNYAVRGLVYFFESSDAYEIQENNIDFIAYPNPYESELTIDLGQFYNEITLTIWNPLGQLLSTQKAIEVNQIQTTIEGSPGIYLLEVRTASGKTATLKVSKN